VRRAKLPTILQLWSHRGPCPAAVRHPPAPAGRPKPNRRPTGHVRVRASPSPATPTRPQPLQPVPSHSNPSCDASRSFCPFPGTSDNNRYKTLDFKVNLNTVLHGFAGYFETILYKNVTLSIRPDNHSPGMYSWFPILFPLKQPICVKAGETVCARFWRCANAKKVWYEWAVTTPECSAIHNPTGRSYTIGL
ncbi:protein arginine N-methyltransferase 5, partial [Cetorhinus maximus]